MIAIRVSNGDDWSYVEWNGSLKTASQEDGFDGVRLRSDDGGVVWQSTKEDEEYAAPFPDRMLRCMGSGWANIYPSERISFGKVEGATYNEVFDLSLSKIDTTEGFVLAPPNLDDGDLVLTAWGNGIDLQPGRFRRQGARIWVELVEPHKVGERCFLLDETGRRIVSASMPSVGGDEVRVAPPKSFVSWLWAVESSASKAMSERFTVEPEGNWFAIKDWRTGKRYLGKYKTSNKELETQDVHWALTSNGVGGLISDYVLRRG